MDKRFQVYRARFGNGRSAHDLIAFYGPVVEPDDEEREPMVRCVMATDYGCNPAVKENLVSLSTRERFTQPVTERWARRLHPRMYAYLDPCEGYSTITVIRYGPSQGRVEFDGLPALYCGFGWSSACDAFHRAPLIGTDTIIERIKAEVLAHPETFYLDRDILPATPKDFRFTVQYHASAWGANLTVQDIKVWLSHASEQKDNDVE